MVLEMGMRERALRAMDARNYTLRGANSSLRGANSSLRGANSSLRGANSSLRGARSTGIPVHLAGGPSVDLAGAPIMPLPFITRLETWYKAHLRRGTLPEQFRGLSLDEVHKATGVGRLKFTAAYALKLHGVDLRVSFNGEPRLQLCEPVVENFPGMWDFVSTEEPGVTETEIHTKNGKLKLEHVLLEENVLSGTDPYLKRHLISGPEDYAVVEHILERAELVPLSEKVKIEEAQIGEDGLVVPLLQRIPFQQVLLEYLGETALFYALHDEPEQVQRLIEVLDAQLVDNLSRLDRLEAPYVEFPDNLHGLMTNRRLFAEFCLPSYQQYTEILHAQGKFVGSHMDGDVRSLLDLIPESGLDVCELFSPAPLTSCSFDEAWQAWEAGPMIWGGIPSPILEAETSQEEFEAHIDRLFERIDRPMILGVVDLFMVHNSIERVEAIARRVAQAAQSYEDALELGIGDER